MAARTLRHLILLAALAWGCQALADDGAELVLVVHPDSGLTTLSRDEAINIFMGRHRQLPSGITALPVDLAPARAEFYQLLTDKTLAQINSYWARLVFSGRASPPRQAQDAAEVLDIVANSRGAIGYVRRRDLSAGVRPLVGLATWRNLQTASTAP
ncbi:MAG: hypothetical protein RBR91_10515 [Porticoccaceae bacterium]|jgi:hypothetical protein|nr:hypothetical protein [Porticoccaceae bacterium]MEA3300746.1 hypothetical protein [Pseudomonadota bacterium]HLS98639.1 hypothetical protein [Porticoccaceae bacterium]